MEEYFLYAYTAKYWHVAVPLINFTTLNTIF